MTLDSLPPLEAHRREREYDRTTHDDWLVEQSIDERDMSGSGWDGVMAASPAHMSGQHWPERSGIDLRVHDRQAAEADGWVREDREPKDAA